MLQTQHTARQLYNSNRQTSIAERPYIENTRGRKTRSVSKRTSCTSTDLHTRRYRAQNKGTRFKIDPQHELTREDTSLIESHHREAASRSSRRIKIPLKLAPRHRTHNLEKDLPEQNKTRRDNTSTKFDISSAATDETTCNQELS